MNDLFDRTIQRYLEPISSLKNGIGDAYYFLRKDGAFIFTEGYLHPEGGLMGKVMLYPILTRYGDIRPDV